MTNLRTIGTIINAETPVVDFTVDGFTFTIVAPFTAGMEMTEGEASALNQLLRENIRNNAKSWINDLEHDNRKGFEDPQDALDAYVAEYAFGVTGGGGRKADPLTTEMRLIVAARLEGLGWKKKDAAEAAKDPEAGFRAYLAKYVGTKQGLTGQALTDKVESIFAVNFEKVVRKPAMATIAKRTKQDDLTLD